MKLKFYLPVIAGVLMFCTQTASAQCGVAGRYIDTIFSANTVTTVTYSDTFALLMDIYQPTGDTALLRPLVILAHGGSFIGGDRTDDATVTTLCADLASKGYVTASIDYRIVSTLAGQLQFATDTTFAITEVMQAISDMKAAVRYFYKNVIDSGNAYKIDTNKIFVGGNSAGAVIAVHYGYLDTLSKAPAYMQGVINDNGGLAGNSGNPGFSNKVRGIVNLAGGLNNPEWITPCSLPVVSAQGTADQVVPYTCGYPDLNPPTGPDINVRLCGLGSMQPFITPNAYYYNSILFPGQGHVPWQSDAGMMYSVDSIVTLFLNYTLCSTTPTTCPAQASGIAGIASKAQISLFPNPASDLINIESSELITSLFLFDETGRTVAGIDNINTTNYQLNTSTLSRGVYLVKISNRDEVMPVIRKVVIE